MPKPTIRDFMTPSPLTIGADQPLSAAHRKMRDHEIRHLPVLKGGRLAGVLTERDVQLIENLPGVDSTKLRVEEAMTPDPYCVTPDASLWWVASEMADHKYGCTLVVEEDHVIGVFTTVDALRALTDMKPGKKPGKSAARSVA